MGLDSGTGAATGLAHLLLSLEGVSKHSLMNSQQPPALFIYTGLPFHPAAGAVGATAQAGVRVSSAIDAVRQGVCFHLMEVLPKVFTLLNGTRSSPSLATPATTLLPSQPSGQTSCISDGWGCDNKGLEQMQQKLRTRSWTHYSVSSPSITITSSEGCLAANFSAVSCTPVSTPSSMVGEYSPALVQPSSSHCIPSSGHSLLSKSVFCVPSHPHLIRQTSDSHIHRGGSSQISEGMHEGRHSFRLSGSSGGESSMGSAGAMSDRWSMHTFSELVASSRRERLRWTSANSPSDFGWGFTRDTLDRTGLITETIQAGGAQALAGPHTEGQACGICSRLLTRWSPWVSCRTMGHTDSTVVGVLGCGHVYHADCLELATPDARRQDPPCPQCWRAAEKVVKREEIGKELTTVARQACSNLTSVQGTLLPRVKLSRVGVTLDDISDPDIGNQLVQPSGSGKRSLGKLMSMQHFPFRKTNVALPTEALVKMPGSPAQVCPGNASDDQPNYKQSAKLQSSSAQDLRRR